MEIKNCPSCGAQIQGVKCQCCGTMFYDFADIDIARPIYLRINFNGNIIVGKAILNNMEIIQNEECAPIYLNKIEKIYYRKNYSFLSRINVEFLPLFDVSD